MLMAVIISPGSIACSLSGVAPGRRKKSSTATWRSPRWTVASKATSAMARSPGYMAMQASLVPSTAWPRVTPPIAEQPLPGAALVAGGKVGGIAEIGAARALHQIAADGRHVADLRRSRLPQRFRDGGEAALDVGMVGDVAHLGQRADGGAAARRRRSASSPLRWVMSTRLSGSATPHLARSISVVPPASSMAPGRAAAWRAASTRSRREDTKNPS